MKKIYTKVVLIVTVLITSYSIKVFSQTAIPTGSFSTTCPDSGTPSWDNSVLSGGDRIIVFIKANSAITAGTPTNGYTTYTASSDLSSLGTAYQNDAAATCIYKGTGANVSLTNMAPGTTYHFLVFNTNAGTTFSSALAFSGSTPAGPGNVSGLAAATGNGQSSVSWTNPSTCYDEVMIVGSTASVTGSPSGNGSAYSDNLSLGSGTAFGGGFVVYKGSSSPKIVTNLTNGLTYFFKTWARKGSTWSSGVETSITLPPRPVTGGSFTATCIDAGTVAWTNPSTIYNLVVFRKSGSAITVGTPTVNASSINLGDAYENDPSAVCVYNSTSGTSVNLNSLTAGTNYFFLVYNINGTNYSSSTTFNNSTLTTPPQVTGPGAVAGNGTVTLNWTNPASCFDEVMVVAKETTAVTATPSGNGSSYTANPAFGSGTAISAGEFVVYKGIGTSVPVTNLTNCVLANFSIFTRKGTTWSSGVTISDTPTSPVSISTISPANGSINAATNSKLTITFNQNISISSTGGSGASQSIVITENGSAFQTITRGSGNISIAGNVATITINTLALSNSSLKTYDVVVGDKVFSACGNDFGGISSGNWTFSSSPGVTITKPTTGVCVNTFNTIGNIVIQETASNNFQGIASASRTLILSFDTPGFAFKAGTSGITILGTGGDINSATPTSVSFGGATLTLTFASGNVIDDLDQITIQGLQVTSDGTNSSGKIIIDASSTISIQGVTNGTTDLATINSGAVPATPTLVGFSSGSGQYCQGTNISGITVNVTGSGITWYSDSNLTTVVYSGNPANLSTNLLINSAISGNYTFYAAQTSTCKSAGLAVPIILNPSPGASSGLFGTTQCQGNPIVLGGSPTVSTPSSPPYTYAWTELTGNYTGGPIAAVSNPPVTINNTSGVTKNYQFRVTVTDNNSCTGTSTSNFNVFSQTNPILTQPASNSFTTNTPAQTLDSNFPATSYTGIGVVQTGPTTYKFDPQQAYDNTQPLPQQFDIYFNGTDPNGCPITNYKIATFFISNSTFTFLVSKYCESEYPYGAFATGIDLQLSSSASTSLTNYRNAWNSSYRFNYNNYTVPLWNAGTSYNAGDLVYFGSEIYRSTTNGNLSLVPGISPFWTPGAFSVNASAYSIRNYYEGYYGGNSPNPTIRKAGATYYLYTNPNYLNCPACNYSYPAVYVELTNPLDIRYRISPWYPSGSYYYPNDLVTFGGQIYKCLAFNISNAGIPPSISGNWSNVTGTGFDNGSVFYDPVANKAGFYILGQFVQVNKTPVISLAGLVDDQNICEQNLLNNGFVFNLKSSLQTGSIPNAGTFEISFDGGNTWVKDLASSNSINNSGINSGLATFNSKNAFAQAASVTSGGSYAWSGSTTYSKYDNVTFGGKSYSSLQNGNFNKSPATNPSFWIENTLSVAVRLYYDPGTTGSSNTIICSGTDVVNIFLHKTPDVAFQIPAAPKVFCTGEPIDNINTVQTIGVVLSGYGVVDTNNGTGKFNPANAFAQSVANGGSGTLPQNIVLTATITDAFSCQNKVTNNFFTVNNPPVAAYQITSSSSPTVNISTSSSATNIPICYGATKLTFTGSVGQVYFIVGYSGNFYNFGSQGSPQQTFDFTPSFFFDYAVTNWGANGLAPISFSVDYFSYDNRTPTRCESKISAVTVTVSPALQLSVTGIKDGDVYCANEGTKNIKVAPFAVGASTLKITIAGNTTNNILTSDTYPYPLSNAVLGDIIFVYDYSSASGSSCSVPIFTTLKVVPSPTSQFSVSPKCDGTIINFNGSDASGNTIPNTKYLWTFADNPLKKSNQKDTLFRFSRPGNFDITLDIAYPINSGKVCSANNINKTQTQVVGPIPTVDFSVSNVCAGDATNFVSSETNGVVDYKWDFDDGSNKTIYGSGVSNVSGIQNTTGTFKDPIHTYIPSTYNVTLTGRTAANQGACEISRTRKVSILNKQTIFPNSPYSMGNTNGNWVFEDRGGVGNWTFGSVSPDGTDPKKQPAWNNVPYNVSDQSYVNSPCFDMSAYTKPAFAIQYFMDGRQQQDGAVLQYSTDVDLAGVQLWYTIGQVNTGLNWYTTQGISGKPGDPFNPNFYGWSKVNDTDWTIARQALDAIPPAKRGKVRFRLAFGSDGGSTNGAKGFAFNNVSIVERNRLSLIENFTNNFATGSLSNNQSFQSFINTNSEVVGLQYNIGLPTPDDINKQNPDYSNARASFYGITNSSALIPRAYIDGGSQGDFSGPWLAKAFSVRSLKASPINLSFTNTTTTTSVTAVATQNITAGNLRLYFALVEKVVGSDKSVVRKMFPDAAGQAITIPFVKSATVTLDANPFTISSNQIGSISQLAAVAFVQDINSREVLQAAYLPTLTNLPAIVTGLEPEPSVSSPLSFYPVPANKELVVSLPEAAQSQTPFVMFDAVGKAVHQTAIDKGQQSKTINTQDFAPGVYLIQLETDKGTVRKKVMVVH